MSLHAVLARHRRSNPVDSLAKRPSIQATTLDLLWIRDGVACFAGARTSAPLLRAVLVLDGPAHTPRALADADPGALAGYRALLGSLDHRVQVLVRTEAADDAAEAARWEACAINLPPPLAALAREHAAWARRELPLQNLLVHHAYLVVPAEGPPTDDTSPAVALRRQIHPPLSPVSQMEQARVTLEDRCFRLIAALGAAGVGARRLGDLDLARLYRACWSPRGASAERVDRDLVAVFGSHG
jgi:hypothetical protein